MESGTPQKTLFEKLRQFVPAEQSLAECLQQWLNVSSDSAYRRIRGETPLTVNELAVLSEKTGLSANDLLGIGNPKQVLFEPTLTQAFSNSFEGYIADVIQHLRLLDSFPEKQIIYCSKDMPIFHYFLLPEIAAFKYHFWSHIIMQDPAFQDKRYEPLIQSEGLKKMLDCALDIYNHIPSIEIWNTESLNSTLFHIDFYRNSRQFSSSQDIKRLYDLLDVVIDQVEKQAELGAKFKPGENPELHHNNFQLFFNQVSLADNTMLAITPQQKFAVINYGVLNYLTCYDQGFCESVANDLHNIIRRSTKLSDGNVKQRAMFFNALHEKVNNYRKII